MGFTHDDDVTRRESSPTRLGFTLIELLVSLILFSITMALASISFAGYQSRTAAQRSAQVFAMDLSFARTSAVRSREAVTVDFDENNKSYVIRLESGDTLLVRRFGAGEDIPLDSLNLQLTGDSVAFNSRGVADLSGTGSSLAVASFASGETIYDVSFTVMGASRVESR